MEETTFTQSPMDPEASRLARVTVQYSSVPMSRSVVLSLLVFLLSFALLFAGPALALRLMAASVGAPGIGVGYGESSPGAHSALLDTTVILQQGNFPTSAYTGTVDTYLNKWKPTTNTGDEVRFAIGQDGAYRTLLYFDLTPAGIPLGASVTSARLGIFCYDRNLANPMEIGVYQVVRPWTESGATWQRATATDLWDIAGCDDLTTDRLATPVFSRTVSDRGVFHYFDVTAIVQNWVSNPASNKGFILLAPNHTVIYYYASSEWSVIEQRPELVITWGGATPTPTQTPSPTPTQTPTGPTPTRTATPTPTRTATPTPPPVAAEVDSGSACYSDFPPGQWQTAFSGSAIGGSYRYETTNYFTGTAVFSPCVGSAIPEEGIYEVFAHWVVHSARPLTVPYTVRYLGGAQTIYVNQTQDIYGGTTNFSPSGWYSLGRYPFRAGTGASTGEYVELTTASPGDTCADAVRWVRVLGAAGPPYTVTVSADPTELPSDGASIATIFVTVTDAFGNMVDDGTMVGFTTTLGTLPYAYTEAESAAVTKLGTWNTGLATTASAGAYIYSDNPGDEAVWSFQGPAVSFIYATNVGGGAADIIIDGAYFTTTSFASGSMQWLVERQLINNLSPGPHTLRVRHAGGGRIWLDAFRSGAVTSGGVATAPLTAPAMMGTATVRATALRAGGTGTSTAWPWGVTTVSFPGPLEVWVDDNYCNGCPNDGHIWNFNAFNTIQGGVNRVLSGGIVHVLPGTYNESVTVAKPLSLLGSGSSSVVVAGTDAPGSRGFYVDRADNVTITGFKVRDFETAIYLRGTGTGAGPRVFNAVVTYNALESNTLYGILGSYVYTSTICSNEISLGNHGIYLQNSHGNVICYNTIHSNSGFGVKIDTGNDNSIDNNNINNNGNVGIELVGQVLRNGVYGNELSDLWWDGVLVNGSGGASVNIAANVIANTNQAWLNASSGPPDANHNRGAVALSGITADSIVRDNRISSASNAGGSRPDAAGVYLFNNTVPITIESNLIVGGAGHGVFISSTIAVTAPVVHGNSIWGNSRFGLNNQLITRTHAEGNWWGRNAPTFGPSTPADIGSAASVYHTPPISVSLKAAPSTIPANGEATSAVTATAQGFGYNILDGTLITFTSDLSTLIYPAVWAFGGGKAYATLRAGTLAGVALVTGFPEPGLAGYTTTVTLTAGVPASIELVAHPLTIPNSCEAGQNRAAITATVRDKFGNPVPGVPVSFSSNAVGSVFPNTSTTLAGTGTATTTFTAAAVPGTAIVTGTASITLTASANIRVTAGLASVMNIGAAPSSLPANGVATSTLTVVMQDCLGNPVPDGTMVGFTTTLGSIVNYRFVEAESAAVITSTGWTIFNDASASGGRGIQSTVPGAVASWVFRGEAVSILYRRYASGGVMRVRVDGGTPMDIDTNGSAAWIERVIANNLDPAVDHQIEVTVQSATIRLDAFRSGPVSSGGVARAVLRAPVLNILSPSEVHTATVYATERVGPLPNLVVTTNVTFTQAPIVWVDDNWTGLANGTPVTLPPYVGGGTATIGADAFDTIPKGVTAVQTGGTVRVLEGLYPLPVVVTRTMNLLGDGSDSTVIAGSGAGTGLVLRRPADNVTIEGFGFRNWNIGVHLDGRVGNRVVAPTFVGNAIVGSVTGAITATYVDNGYLAGNEIYNGSGYGIDLYTGAPNRFISNHIHDIGGFGLRLRSTTGAEISYNEIHDVGWNGIVVGDSCVNTTVLRNTVRTTNLVNSPSGFNEGGIVLYNSTNTTVEYNDVSDVRDAGGSTNTAGVWVGGTDSGARIRYNYILNNRNDGVLLLGFGASPPVIQCNHIYGNGRYGLRHATGSGVDVHAEGNWWGHNPPLSFDPPTAPPPGVDIGNPADVLWSPPISLVLTPAQPTVSAGGPALVITATACGGGCCLLDGTPITFTTSLGRLGSPPQSLVVDSMSGGRTTVLFTPGTVAGTAIITGFLPNNGVATTTVTILPLAPYWLNLSAYPTRIPVATTAVVTAEVTDQYNNPVLPGTLVYFDSSLGSVTPSSRPTNASGVATSTLQAGLVPGFATVWAYSGFAFDAVQVEVTPGRPFTITALVANPNAIRANGLDMSWITATVRDQYNNLVQDMTMVGFTTTAGSLVYKYVEAESAEVVTSTGWSPVNDATASGGRYIQTSTAGASAYWNFRGEAVSVIYRRFTTGGVMRVRIDGASPVDIDTSGSAAWVERVIAADLDPSMVHQIEVTRLSGTIRLDAFRSGGSTSGGQTFARLTAATLPPVTARVYATAIDIAGVERVVGTFPTRTVTVDFTAPREVWVDDDYCSTCPNDGHQWGYDAFDNIPDGITAVANWGTVHVLDGVYWGSVTVNKPIYLDGAGSGGTTHLIGTGTGSGIFVNHLADGTTVEGFAITNFGFGIHLGGGAANAIDGITVTNNVVTGCATGAFTATFVNDGRIYDNAFYRNNGFGLDLNAGNRNRIQNNHIFANGGFGLRVVGIAGAANDNDVTWNNIYDIGWDGIRIGAGTTNTRVLSNTVMNTNRSTGGGFDLGGIGLYGTTDVRVEGNVIAYVQNASGLLPDTAGIGLDGNNLRPVILKNWIRHNVNHGIWLSTSGYAASGPLELHGNSIFANGKFGIFSNVTTVAANAQGNWWSHNTPTTSTSAAVFPRDIFTGLGANVTYTPPIVMSIARAPNTIVADGVSTSNVTVTMRCATCTPVYDVLDGTLITFTNSLGSFGVPPVQRSTLGGQAFATLQSGTVAGRSYITATTPLQSVFTWVDFIAGPAFTVTVGANPPVVWSATCAPPGYPTTSTITVTVTDRFGNPCAGQPVTYTVGAGGSLAWTTGVLDAAGFHLTLFNAGSMAMTVPVTATAGPGGGTATGSVPVVIVPGIPRTSMALEASPTAIAADGVSTSTLTATVYDDCGNLAADGTLVGFMTSHGTLTNGYAEAESAPVITSVGDWTTVANASASGGAYLDTNNPGAWATWSFSGSAVSVIYRRGPTGGQAQIMIDGVPRTTLSMYAATVEWQRETVVATGLDPSVPHTIQVSCTTGRVFLDAFRSGSTTVGGVATSVLTSARMFTTAYITATAVDSRVPALSLTQRVTRTTTVDFMRSNLGITKVTNPEDVAPGGLVTFTLFYTNTGQGQGTAVRITDTLPISLTYVGSTSSPDVGPPSNPSGNIWVWQAGNVRPGASGVIVLTARRGVQPWLGTLTNTVTISSLTLEAVPGNNTSTSLVNFVAGPPFSITLVANPPSVFVGGGGIGQSTIEVTVTDEYGNPAVGQVVTFTLGPGFGAASLLPGTATLDSSGYATTTFTSGAVAGIAPVTATVGAVSARVPVEIMPRSPVTILLSRSPTAIAADGVSTATITATVRDVFGNLAQDGTMVAFVTNRGSVPCRYAEAESSAVVTSTGWAVVTDGNASGGRYLSTNTVGAWARWTYTGSAVSLIYVRSPVGGSANVFVDGVLRKTVSMYAGSIEWQREVVIFGGSDPSVPHLVEVQVVSGWVFVDAFRCGTTTVNGVATAVLTSARLCSTATITGTTVEHRLDAVAIRPQNTTTVDFVCADVTITKRANETDVIPNSLVTFTLTYRNLGQATATGVLVTDTLPITLSYVSSVSAPDVGPPSNPSGNLWVWQVGDVLPQAGGVITLTAQRSTVPWLGVVTNTVRIGTSMVETSTGNNSSSVQLNLIPAPPFSILITATPSKIWVGGGASGRSTIGVTVTDEFGNPAIGRTVTFTWSSGFGGANVSPMFVTLNGSGVATSTLTSGTVAGTILVTATVDGVSRSVPVEIMPGLPWSIVLTPWPTAIAADGVSTATITATVRDFYGNLAYDGTKVGFVTSRGSVPTRYVEAESASVIKSTGDWILATDANASGGRYLYTDNPGAWVSWTFTGSAVSLVYVRTSGGGSARVFVDGVPGRTVSMYAASTEWQREWVMETNLDPNVPHQVEIRCISGRVFVDALQSGYATVDGTVQAILTSAPISATACITGTAVDNRLEAVTGLHNMVCVDFRRADLAIQKGGEPVQLRPGEYVTFTLFYTNTGQAQATNAVITDTLPPLLTYVRSESVPDVGEAQHLGANVWLWSLGHVQPRASGVITFTAWRGYTPWLGAVTNTATIGSMTVDVTTANHTSWKSLAFVPGAPHTLVITATPTVVFAGGGATGRSTVAVTVTDQWGNPAVGETVVFALSPGLGAANVTPMAVVLDGNGSGTTTFTSGAVIGRAIVTATVGTVSGAVPIEIQPGSPATLVLERWPTAIPANGISTSVLTATVRDAFGNLVQDGTMVGFAASSGMLFYGGYAEAESAAVSTSAGWAVSSDPGASGGQFIYTDTPGAWVRWTFNGSAVSVLYARSPIGGSARVYVDGALRRTISMSSAGTLWQREWVIVSGLDPSIPHQIEVQVVSGRVFVDAFRSGTTTVDGVATAVLTSARVCTTAAVTATAVEHRVQDVSVWPYDTKTVQFTCADVGISKTASSYELLPGAFVTFTLVYGNTGPLTATNTVITDTLPMTLTFVGSTAWPVLPAPVNPRDNVWMWRVGDLLPGASGTITVTARRSLVSWIGVVTNTATISTTMPDANPADDRASVRLNLLPGPPFSMAISAAPSRIWIVSGAPTYPVDSRITVTVTDEYGNPCAGQVVTFTWSALGGAAVAPTTRVLRADGTHFATLSSGTAAGRIWVTATVGSLSRSVMVEVLPGMPRSMLLERVPTALPADGVSTSLIIATVRDEFDNLVYDGTMVGFTTTAGSLVHEFVEAEDAPVEKSVGDWSAPSYNVNASGRYHIYTDNPGAWASWRFMGSAVSVMYRRDVSGGVARVLIDGTPVMTINMYSGVTQWQRETVINGLNPAVMHTIRVECISGRIWLDAFRSGATTVNGVATALLTASRECGANYDLNGASALNGAGALVRATAVESRQEVGRGDLVSRETTVDFLCADLAINKEVYPVDVPPRAVVTFTLFYTNTGRAQATETFITDTLPSELTYRSYVALPAVRPPTNPTGNVWVWRIGDLQPGASGVITFTAVSGCRPRLGWITNTVEIGSLTDEYDRYWNTDLAGVRLVAGPPFEVAVSATPPSIQIEQSTTVRITVTDECGNPVAGRTVYITTSIGSFAPASLVTSTTRTTDANGRATLTFYSQQFLGMAVIRATAGEATGTGYVWINVGPPRQCVVTASPATIPADGLSTSLITARVLDAAGYPMPDGYFVGFTTTDGSLLYNYVEDPQMTQSPPGSWATFADTRASGGSYIGTSVDGASVYWTFRGNGVSIVYVQAVGSGWADIYLDGNPLGAINMDGTLTWLAEKVFTWFGDPAAEHVLRVTKRPGTGPIWMDALRSGLTTVGGQTQAELRSASYVTTAVVAATCISETNTIVPVRLPGFVNVRFEQADLSISKSVEPVGAITIGQRITFTVSYYNNGPETATSAYIDDVISDGALGTNWLRDIFFSTPPLTVTPGLRYYWALGTLRSGQGGTIVFGGTVNVERSWPSLTVMTNTVSIQSRTDDLLPGNNTARVTSRIVTGPPVTLTLTATPGTVPVLGSSTLRATAYDVYGNPVADGTAVTFATSLGGFPTVQERVRYTTGGVATQVLSAGTVAGTATVTATVDSLVATARVVITPLDPYTITLTANPTQIPVGGATSLIEAWVTDMYGNFVADGTVVGFSTTAGWIDPPSASTVNGRVSAVLASGTVPVTATVTASTSSGTITNTVRVRFVPGEPRVSVAATPLILPVSNTSRITVTARDEFGNPVLDGTVVTLTTSLGNFTDSMITQTFTTTVGGRAFARLHSSVAGRALVQATVAPNTGAVVITFEPGDPHYIRFLSVEPAVIIGCGGTATATVLVEDRYRNPVRNGTVVAFDVTPQGDVEPIDGGRTTNGIAQAIISSDNVPGPATVWAWPVGWSTSVVAQFGIVFQVGPPDRLELVAEPPRLPVGGNNATIRVRVLDCANLPVTDGTPVTFTLVSGGGILSPQNTTTANGYAFSTLTSPNNTGSATVRVNAGDREATVVVEYIAGPPFDVVVTASPLSIAANGVSTSTIVAEIRDRYGNFVADRTRVDFSTTLGRFVTGPGSTAPTFSTSTAGGSARAVLVSSTSPGMARVAAESGGKRGEAFVDFYFVPIPTPTPTPTPTRAPTWTVRLPIIMKGRAR